eukprot:CAMPEP_0204319868 /NCGR_PEP_ID=MMETSP0469-20131031/7336_1 /ASSEMBLY_ACC=CAM_ASM_000384 /TAXON_ID=2969 /ORGANISM="Oxyrrhis marina" /LENGTH=38 /DNA_ID= /DNA_START= /DNA_END= /DNA_ORIENTATION=
MTLPGGKRRAHFPPLAIRGPPRSLRAKKYVVVPSSRCF